jgi:DNA-binding beta-propeller fold protein YncE
MAIRETASGALVFAGGGLDFARTLSAADVADTKAQRLVANVLYRALGSPLPALHKFNGWREAKVASVVDRVRTAAVFAGIPGDRGTDDGPRGTGRLKAPLAVAAAPDGSLLVTDGTSGAVRRVATDGTLSTVADFPRCSSPIAVAADSSGRIWVADGDYGVIYERAVDGTIRAIGQRDWADVIADGPANTARFAYPAGLALSRDGKTLWVADRNGDALRTVDLTSEARTVTTVARGGQVGRPTALAMAPDGGLYVQDIGSRVFLWKSGKASVVAGYGALGYADGPAAKARFVGHGGLAVLPSGALLISDPGNYRVRKLAGGNVSTFAGNGRGADGPGESTALILPSGVAVGRDGKVYVAEAGNGTVRVLTP